MSMKSIQLIDMDIDNGMLLGCFKTPAAGKNVAFGLYNKKTRALKTVKLATETRDHSVFFKLPLHQLPFSSPKKGLDCYDCFAMIDNKTYCVKIGAKKVINRLAYMDEKSAFMPSEDSLALFTAKEKRLLLFHGDPFLAVREGGRCFRGKKIVARPHFSDGRLVLTLAKPPVNTSDDLRFRLNAETSFPGTVTDSGDIVLDLDHSLWQRAAGSDLFLDVRRGLTLITFPVILNAPASLGNASEEIASEMVPAVSHSAGDLIADEQEEADEQPPYVVSGKRIISDLKIDVEDQSLSFIIHNLDGRHASKSELVLCERSSGTEWRSPIENHRAKQPVSLILTDFIKTFDNHVSRWDLFVEITNDAWGVVERYRLGVYDRDTEPKKHKRYLGALSTDGGNRLAPYLTIKNGLSFVIKNPILLKSEQLKTMMKITRITLRKGRLVATCRLELPEVDNYTIESLGLKHRNQSNEMDYLFSVQERKLSREKSRIHFSIDLERLDFENYYWDFFLIVQADGEQFYIRLKNPKHRIRRKLNRSSIRRSHIYDNGFWVYPYITSVNTLALTYKEKQPFETTRYFLKERLAFVLYILLKWYLDRKKIWLGYEKFSESAQDNGYYFFRYCMENKKKKNFYYIIKKNSPDYPNIADLRKNLITFMSLKYMLYLYAARLLISSESRGHAYDIRVQKGRLQRCLKKKKHVFLQHGVIALKKVDQVYKKSGNNASDLFVVSSEQEKAIIRDHFGYDDNEIIVTGLSRWDVLQDKSDSQRMILLMPTWRSWMDDWPEEKFLRSDYYRHYADFLNSKTLFRLLDRVQCQLCFYIHPKFKAYIDKFQCPSDTVKIYQYGEEKLNELLMESSMLITDYSSVAWDMFYQKKPIIFYQFDIDDYMRYQGSYMDMEKDLFGDRVYDADQLIAAIRWYAERQFTEKEAFAQLRDRYFAYTDHKNAERIYQSIVANEKKLYMKDRPFPLYERLRRQPLVHSLWRHSKKYALANKLAQKLKNEFRDHG